MSITRLKDTFPIAKERSIRLLAFPTSNLLQMLCCKKVVNKLNLTPSPTSLTTSNPMIKKMNKLIKKLKHQRVTKATSTLQAMKRRALPRS